MRKNNPEIILKGNREGWLNVFFVVSPLTAIIYRMIIDTYNIKSENILLRIFKSFSITLMIF